jgi:hypothetical protein
MKNTVFYDDGALSSAVDIERLSDVTCMYACPI